MAISLENVQTKSIYNIYTLLKEHSTIFENRLIFQLPKS